MHPFRLKFFSLISEIKRNWICFRCVSLAHYKISLLFFAYFRFKFFASLHFSNFRFEAKQSEAKFKSIFSLFFALNFSLRFDLVIFALKFSVHIRENRKISLQFNIFRIISLLNFVSGEKRTFLSIFCLIFVSLRFFCLIFAYFTFVFASYF